MKHVFLANICFVEIPLVESLLKSNKISFFLKKTYEGSVNAGWMIPGGLFQETMLFVDETELQNAQKLLKQYIND